MDRWNDSSWVQGMALSLDFSNMMSEFVGHDRGISGDEIDGLAARIGNAIQTISDGRHSDKLGFYALPHDLSTAEQIAKTAESLRDGINDFIVLGIGGSALGGIALTQALCHPLHNLLTKQQRHGLPRIFFLENIDPSTIKAVLDFVEPEKTMINVITKSGTTTETLSQFAILHKILVDKIGEDQARRRIVVTTGPEKKALRSFAEERGFTLFSIPDNVGGRYSVFTPVGLFPAAMVGIDIMELLAGARHMEKMCDTVDIWHNPAYMAAVLHYLADSRKGLHVAVIMPYSDRLGKVGHWFRQLWAESLGKARTRYGATVNVGQTPVAALGVTDQHSQLQLYQEGPIDKMITFLIEAKKSVDLSIPGLDGVPEFSHLHGRSLAEMLDVEAESTRFALTKAGRSNMSIVLPEINAHTLGQLFFMFQVQTIFAGELYGIDPLDQPGVEASKDYIYGLTGRSGYENKAAEIRNWRSRPRKYVT